MKTQLAIAALLYSLAAAVDLSEDDLLEESPEILGTSTQIVPDNDDLLDSDDLLEDDDSLGDDDSLDDDDLFDDYDLFDDDELFDSWESAEMSYTSMAPTKYIHAKTRCNKKKLKKANLCDDCNKSPKTGTCSWSYPKGDKKKFRSKDAACRCNP